MTSKQLLLRSQSKRFHKVWFTGVHPQEYSRVIKSQEVECLSISLLCDEILQVLRKVHKSKNQQLRISFQELYYIMSGIIILYKSQVTFLYEQAIRHAQFSLEFVQQSRTSIVFKVPAVPKNKRSRKNSDTTDNLPNKRVKSIVNISISTDFDWRELNDIEVDDNESTIQMLQAAPTMKHDEISLRDEIHDPYFDLDMDIDGFDADGYANTQKFLEIRDLVARGRSIMEIIQNESLHPMLTDGSPSRFDHDSDIDVDEYDPLPCQEDVSLSDIETYQQELEPEIMPPNIDNTIANHEERENSPISIIDEPAWIANDLLNVVPTKRGRKKHNKRRAIDTILQINEKLTEYQHKKLFRCLNPRLDCVNKFDLLRHSQTRIFIEPTHALKDLKPRLFKETPALMAGLLRAKRIKRQEETNPDLFIEFLNSINEQPLQIDDFIPTSIAQRSQSVHEKLPNNSQNERRHETQHERQDETQHERQDETQHERQDETQHDPLLSEPEFEFEPQVEPTDFYEAENESNSPAKRRRVNENREMSNVVRSESSKTYQHVEVEIPRNVLNVLNKFVTVDSTTQSSYGSQTLFVLKNRKNRQKWGLKGVLQNLLRLWNSDIHPIGMKELMHPHKEKIAAALAFYSIMELNSPRIGLITIEKDENCNMVYHIKKSTKLESLL